MFHHWQPTVQLNASLASISHSSALLLGWHKSPHYRAAWRQIFSFEPYIPDRLSSSQIISSSGFVPVLRGNQLDISDFLTAVMSRRWNIIDILNSLIWFIATVSRPSIRPSVCPSVCPSVTLMPHKLGYFTHINLDVCPSRAPEITWLPDCLFTLLIKKWTENWLENSLSI